VSSVSLESNIVPLNSPNSSNVPSSVIEHLSTNNESSQACDHELPVGTISECRTEMNPTTQAHATSIQCRGVDFVTQNSVGNTSYRNRLVKETGSDVSPVTESGTKNRTIPSEGVKGLGGHVSVATSCGKPESREPDGSSAGRLESSLKSESVKMPDSLDQCGHSQHADSLCQASQSQRLQTSSSDDQREGAALLQTTGTSTGCTSK
jgi:hypothetical protein